MRWGIIPLRVVIGIVFLFHGAQKVFVMRHAGVTAFFTRVGIPEAPVAAAVVMAVEFLGGIALILGLGTRIAAALIAIEMIVAILAVEMKRGFPGVELPLTLLAGAVSLTILGGGPLSLDALMRRRA